MFVRDNSMVKMVFANRRAVMSLAGVVFSILLFVTGSCSCGGGKDKREIGKVAVGYVESLYGGDFNKAALHTTGADQASPQYREHLSLLYRNVVENNLSEHGALKKVECYNIKEDNEHHCADVYMRLTFADSTVQDILLPMEEHSGQWLMK